MGLAIVTQKDGATDSSQPKADVKPSLGQKSGHSSQLKNRSPVPDGLESSGAGECSLPHGSGQPNTTGGGGGRLISLVQEVGHCSRLENKYPILDHLESSGAGECSLPPGKVASNQRKLESQRHPRKTPVRSQLEKKIVGSRWSGKAWQRRVFFATG